jgi:hypothetical protein
MKITTIDGTIEYIEMILQRKVNVEEILLIGIAFQNGIMRELEEAEKRKEKEKEKDK